MYHGSSILVHNPYSCLFEFFLLDLQYLFVFANLLLLQYTCIYVFDDLKTHIYLLILLFFSTFLPFHSILFFSTFLIPIQFLPFHSIFFSHFFNFPNPYTISLNLNHLYHLEICKIKPLHNNFKPFYRSFQTIVQPLLIIPVNGMEWVI